MITYAEFLTSSNFRNTWKENESITHINISTTTVKNFCQNFYLYWNIIIKIKNAIIKKTWLVSIKRLRASTLTRILYFLDYNRIFSGTDFRSVLEEDIWAIELTSNLVLKNQSPILPVTIFHYHSACMSFMITTDWSKYCTLN